MFFPIFNVIILILEYRPCLGGSSNEALANAACGIKEEGKNAEKDRILPSRLPLIAGVTFSLPLEERRSHNYNFSSK